MTSRVDALVMTALLDEFVALRAVHDGAGRWSEARDGAGFPYHHRLLGSLRVAAAWIGEMGETAAATRTTALVGHLAPKYLAMCGICAGNRSAVVLGDVIVADRVYSYDHGKILATRTPDGHRDVQVFRNITTYNLGQVWRIHAGHLAIPGEYHTNMQRDRPVARAHQERWLCHQLAEQGRGITPQELPDRKARCPDWPVVVEHLRAAGLVRLTKDRLSLTRKGRDRVREEQLAYPDGLPDETPFRVHIGAIATGKTVQRDPELFTELERSVCKTIGVEMEAAAIGHVADHFERDALIIKAVADHGDHDKDDRFRAFAARAAADVLLHLLMRGLTALSDAPLPTQRNPYRPAGTLPPDHPTYVRRACDDVLEATLRDHSTIAIEGDFEIGKSSLMMRVKTALAETHSACYIDLSDFRDDQVVHFLDRVFDGLSRGLGRKIRDWPELDVATERPLALILDELAVLTNPGAVSSLFTRLTSLVERRPEIRILVCLAVGEGNPSIREFLAHAGLSNPKHRDRWHRIEVPRFTGAEIDRLLALLPARAQDLARAHADAILTLSSGRPIAVQRLCSVLFEAAVAGRSEAELQRLLTSREAYER